MTMQNNPFAGFLEDSPEGFRANFFSRPGTRGSANRTQFFQREFENIQNQFLGQLGAQIRAGGQPNTTGEQFLNEFDFNRTLALAAPAQRGQGFQSRFAPTTRSFFF